jgi:hypothetical protein
MVSGMPAAKTILAASGSPQILNSAVVVMLPPIFAPPMKTMRLIRFFRSG